MNNCKPTVAVLMSTYNGEKYIKEQLDSIFSQTGVNVKLYVRDDGSIDRTLDILEKYKQNYPITFLRDNVNVGPGESFLRLVYKFAHEREIDYFAFADQDDIWLPNKLGVAIKNIKSCNCDEPVLYSSNQFLYIGGENKGLRHKEKQSVALIPHMNKNTIAGCTFVFNKKLAQLVADAEKPDSQIIKFRLHDSWLMLIAIACGRVIYDERSYMLYRIHDRNVVGIREISILDKIYRIKRMIIGNQGNLRMKTAKELLRLFPAIKKENTVILGLYANYKNTFSDRLELFFNEDISKYCLENPLVFKLKVLLGFV